MLIQKSRRRVYAADEIVDDVVDTDVDVAPEAATLLFEAEDVAQLVAEVTGDDVAVETDDEADTVTFTVGDENFTVEPEGDEEIVESSVRTRRSKKTVSASTRTRTRRPATASQKSRTVRRIAR